MKDGQCSLGGLSLHNQTHYMKRAQGFCVEKQTCRVIVLSIIDVQFGLRDHKAI